LSSTSLILLLWPQDTACHLGYLTRQTLNIPGRGPAVLLRLRKGVEVLTVPGASGRRLWQRPECQPPPSPAGRADHSGNIEKLRLWDHDGDGILSTPYPGLLFPPVGEKCPRPPEHSAHPFLCLEQSESCRQSEQGSRHGPCWSRKAPEVDAAVSRVTLQGPPPPRPHSRLAVHGQGSWGNRNREWPGSGGSMTVRDGGQRKGPRAPDMAAGGGG